MSFVLKDGTGTGKLAKVDEHNRQLVLATARSQEHVVSERDGQSYFANTADTADTLTLATGNTYNLLYLKNTSSTKLMTIQKIAMSTSVAGGVLIFQKNMVLGTVSANNVHIPINTNFSSGNAADVLAHNWDETGTVGIGGLSGGTLLKSFTLGTGPVFFPIDGFMLLGQNDSLTLRIVNGTGGAIEAECGIRFYFIDIV